MKRKNVLKALSGAVICSTFLLFSACDNFMQGSELQNRIESTIKKEAAPFINFAIKNDSTQGAVIPVANVYKASYKVTDTEEISFTARDDYQFLYWDASPSGYIKFGDVKAPATTIEFLEGADKNESLVLTPVCAERPYPTVDPSATGGDKPKNTSVIINFGKVIQNPKTDLSKIDIQIPGEGSIKNHYLTPEYINDGRAIQFYADDNNLLDFTTGTKTVNVIIPNIFYFTEPDGTKVQMAKEVTSSFTINYTTKSSATISLEADTQTGSLYPSGNNTYYMGEQFTVVYEMNSEYQFDNWLVSAGEEDTVEVKNGKVYLNNSEVLEEVTQDSQLDEYYKSQNKYRKTYKVISSARYLRIKPLSYPKPKIQSITPLNKETCPKNSPIIISFSHKMDIFDAELDLIQITSDGISVKDYFNTPVKTDTADSTEISISARRDKLMDIPVGTKTITVTVPQSFGYKKDDTKITLSKDYVYSYIINNETVDKISLYFQANNGLLDTLAEKKLYLDDVYSVHCTPNTGYTITGWQVYVQQNDPNDKTVELSKSILDYTETEDHSGITFTAKEGSEKTIIVEPVCVPKKKVTVYVKSAHGTTIPAGKSGVYYSNEEVSVSYREEADYQFVGWTVSENSNKNISNIFKFEKENIDNPDQPIDTSDLMDSSMKIGNLTEDLIITITAECYKRPQIVSASPLYDTEGVYRDRKISIMYDQKLDVNTIYYDEDERTSIVAENPGKTVTFLEVPGENSSDHTGDYYGYQLDNDEDSIVYKCISIVELQNTSNNLLKYYGVPTFDDNNSGVLRIAAKIPETKDGKVKDVLPPAATDILVSVKTDFGKNVVINGKEKLITFYSTYSWSYFTNSLSDNTAPEIKDVKIKIVQENVPTQLLKTEDIIKKEANLESYRAGTHDVYSKYNAADSKLWLDAKITDGGSGPKSLSAKIYPVDSAFYPFTEEEEKIAVCHYDATLSFSGSNALVSTKDKVNGTLTTGGELISLESLKKSGQYKIVLTALDKNDLSSVYNETFYFLWDVAKVTPPNDITEKRSVATATNISFTRPVDKDYARCVVTSKLVRNADGTIPESVTETTVENYDVTSVDIGSLENQKQYEYTVKFYDYVGNVVDKKVDIDNKAETLMDKTKVLNTRTSADEETIDWSNFTTALDFDHAVVQCWLDGVQIGDEFVSLNGDGSIIKDHKFTGLTNQKKYEYRFYSVDYSGNKSTDYVTFTDEKGPTSLVVKGNISNSRTSADKETISWSANPAGTDVAHVEIDRYYNSSDKATFKQDSVDTKTNTFTGLTNQRRYEYRFYSVDYSGNRSAEYTLYQDTTGPSSLVTKSNISNSRTSADKETISWSANPTGSDVDHIEIDRYYSASDKSTFKQTSSSTKTNTFTGLTNQRKYEYRFYSVDYSGNRSSSYTTYQDNTAPSKVTANQSEGRNHRIILKFTPPNDEDFCNVTVSYGNVNGTQYDMADPKRNTQFTWTIKDDSNPLTNGNTYSYYLRAKDYSGNVSDYICMSETVGAMPGMICYAPGNSYGNIFCSKNYWPGKNPLGLVAGDRDGNQQYVLVLALDETNQYIYGPNNGNFCADNVFSENIGGLPVVGFTAKYNNTTGWHWYNLVTTNDNYKGVATSDSIWAYARDVKNKNSCITWYIPTRVEWQFVAWNWKPMCTAKITLTDNGVNVAGMATNDVYYVATPNYYNNRCNFVGVNYNDNGNMNEHLAEGEWMNLYTTSWKQDKYNRTQNYGAYTRCICDVDMR